MGKSKMFQTTNQTCSEIVQTLKTHDTLEADRKHSDESNGKSTRCYDSIENSLSLELSIQTRLSSGKFT